jgi:hypothetical protein
MSWKLGVRSQESGVRKLSDRTFPSIPKKAIANRLGEAILQRAAEKYQANSMLEKYL